jgi:O-antigen ligase
VGLQSREGTRLLYAALPPLVGIGALLASTSRGGILAFFAALALAAAGVRARRGTPAWAAALVFAAMALTWFGLERLEVRFLRAPDDAPGRTVVWKESVQSMPGRWLTGYGFNTFAEALSRVPAWSLPRGATPWPEAVATPLAAGQRVGYRAPGDLPGLAWYREAHNDYVQLLVETGVPGLLVGLWAALAALAAARRDPWLFAALAGVLMHCLVDFDLQIPAIPALFVCLAALAPGRSGG